MSAVPVGEHQKRQASTTRRSAAPRRATARATSRWMLGLLVTAVLAVGCGDGGGGGGGGPTPPQQPPAPPTDPNTVAMGDNFFNPQSRTVSVGATVRWVNNAAQIHNSTSADGLWSSGNISPGNDFQRQFDSAGSFNYSCTLHPGMNGTIVVE